MRIDRALALMSYIRICALYGRDRLMKGINDVKNSEPYHELDDLARATVLGYAAGRVDSFDYPSGSVSAEAVDITWKAKALAGIH